MTITPLAIRSSIDAELVRIQDKRVLAHILSLLIEPTVVMRSWDYGDEGKSFPCWSVLNHNESNSGIAYCEFGFGPRTPWGLISLSESHTSMGMDSGWFDSFLDAYFDSKAVTELPIWRVFKEEGDIYPGVPLSGEADWNSTWREVLRLRESDKQGRYNCDQSVYVR